MIGFELPVKNEQDHNGCDMKRREEKRLVTKVYRKETHTNRFVNWRSNHSKSFLEGIINVQTHRSNYLCDMKEDLLSEAYVL